jgi:hypothetical protein
VELVIPAVDGSTASLGLVLEGRGRSHGVSVGLFSSCQRTRSSSLTR